MHHIEFLERAGASLAIMSDQSDGDCGAREAARDGVQSLIHRLALNDYPMVRSRQVHGARICDASDLAEGGCEQRPEADGLATNLPGVVLSVGVADCTPVLLFDPIRRAIAALHAGREGTRQAIAASGARFMRDRYGCRSGDILAWIGPCAGVCCYEVSEELAEDWRRIGLPARGRFLDLGDANRQQLENEGVIRHNIQVMPHCTVCGGGYFSYRAHKTLQRNLVLVML